MARGRGGVSLDGESFRLLGESADVRVGIRCQEREHGIEVLVRLAPPGGPFRSAPARDMLDRLDELMGRRYQLTTQDGWWVVCEKAVDEQELPAEGRSVLALFADLLDRP